MTEEDVEVAENGTLEENNPILDGLRRILMAGIGVAVLAQEEIEDFVTRMVDRGEIAENDGRSLISDVLERQKQEIQNNTRKVSDGVDRRLESVLKGLNLPTRSEISSLSKQIDELSKKVDELKNLDE
ncbi:MAG: phasin family protein [Candidatus Promineifilaceae bacterium]|nr:phasin family protein [Candidatus Promineifilaceae bacterium]